MVSDMSDSDKLDQILAMLADLDQRVSALEESKGEGQGGGGQGSQGQSQDSAGEQDGDSDGKPEEQGEQEQDTDWDTPDPIENEFPEEEKPRKANATQGVEDDDPSDDDTCDSLNCGICAGTSMRESCDWSDSGEPV
jgi:hypothetical protein